MNLHLNTYTQNSLRPLVRLSLITCLVATAGSSVLAQTQDKKDAGPWNVSLGLGVVSAPEYEGGNKRKTSAAPDINLSYKTQDFGTFAAGTRSRGLAWTILDKEEYSFGIALGLNGGRDDKKEGSLLRPGSKRLNGLGEIKAGGEFSVFGSATLGVPFNLRVTRGLGDGKVDAKDFSINGHNGTLVEAGAYIPVPLSKELMLSFSPNVVWADEKYTQTFFGVTTAQAARSNFKAFNAKSGVKSVGIDTGLNYQYDKNWSGNVGISINQLQGDASKSPIVEKKLQTTFSTGVVYTF